MSKNNPDDIKHEQLAKFSIFCGVSDEILNRVSNIITIRYFKDGEVVCTEHNESFSLFLIDSGKVEITQKDIPLAILSSGNLFGEMSLLGDSTARSATVTSKGDSVLFEISFDDFKPIVSASTEILTNLILTYDQRLRSENKVVVNQYQELQKKYKQLQESNEQLLQTEKMASIGTLTASVAHEVNNPLAVVHGHITLLESKIKKEKLEPEMLNKSLDQMKKASDAIKKIVIGLKTYVRIDSGEDTIISLNKAVEALLISFHFYIKRAISK